MDKETDLSLVRQQLKKLIQQRVFKKNSVFKTPSGVVTTFFDFLEVSLKHKGIELAGEMVFNEIKNLDIHAVGGPSHGIVSILCRAAFLKKIGVFYIRDSIKKEGNIHAPKWIESRIKGGDKVAIVGDVVSSGSQIIRSIQQVMLLGGEIKKIVIIIDSEEGNGVENITRFLQTNMLEAPIKVIFTRTELIDEANS